MGVVVGTATNREFEMAVRDKSVNVQEIVAVKDDGRVTYAKMTQLRKLNPLFPREAAQELALEASNAYDLPFSFSHEMITADCRVIGERRGAQLEPPLYPVRPAASVVLPPQAELETLFSGELREHHKLHVGHLRGNEAVRIHVDAHAVVARHLGVLATTGAGKTVAVRRIIEQLMEKRYPVLIFDPHGDYIGLHGVPAAAGLDDVQVVTYLPRIDLGAEDPEGIIAYMRGLCGGGEWTDPQLSLGLAMADALKRSDTVGRLGGAFTHLDLPPLQKSLARDHFYAIGELADRLRDAKGEGRLPRSITAIPPSLDFVNATTAQVLGRRASTAGKRYARCCRRARF